jgi:hypothetical protein
VSALIKPPTFGSVAFFWKGAYATSGSNAPISLLADQSAGATCGDGHMYKMIFSNSADARASQRTRYLEDQWLVGDCLLLSLEPAFRLVDIHIADLHEQTS